MNLDKCTGCRSCEIACSYHFNKVFNPDMSAIKVWRSNETGAIELWLTSSCDLCENEEIPLCVKYCAAEALTICLGTSNNVGRQSLVRGKFR